MGARAQRNIGVRVHEQNKCFRGVRDGRDRSEIGAIEEAQDMIPRMFTTQVQHAYDVENGLNETARSRLITEIQIFLYIT